VFAAGALVPGALAAGVLVAGGLSFVPQAANSANTNKAAIASDSVFFMLSSFLFTRSANGKITNPYVLLLLKRRIHHDNTIGMCRFRLPAHREKSVSMRQPKTERFVFLRLRYLLRTPPML